MTPEEQYEEAMRELDDKRKKFDKAREDMYAARERMYAARDRAREARQSTGRSFGGVVFGEGGGIVADVVTGGMVMNVGNGHQFVSVAGQIITGGVPLRCSNCGGTSGWVKQDNVMRHAGCGAAQ